ncbi:hypothetical protein D3C81_1762340 [compost metagenome]
MGIANQRHPWLVSVGRLFGTHHLGSIKAEYLLAHGTTWLFNALEPVADRTVQGTDSDALPLSCTHYIGEGVHSCGVGPLALVERF